MNDNNEIKILEELKKIRMCVEKNLEIINNLYNLMNQYNSEYLTEIENETVPGLYSDENSRG